MKMKKKTVRPVIRNGLQNREGEKYGVGTGKDMENAER
jgi:hypothetical protein